MPTLKFSRVPDKLRPTHRKITGREYGISLWEFIAALLGMNELLPKDKKLTDESLKLSIIKEYPPAICKISGMLQSGKKKVGWLRTLYNRGDLTQHTPPDIKSVRYTAEGEEANPFTGRAKNVGGGTLAGLATIKQEQKRKERKAKGKK